MDEHPQNAPRIPIEPGTTFRFECTMCGECCRGDIRISLNLLDLQRMAEFLKLETTGNLFEQGWVDEGTLNEGGFRPYIRFKEKPMRFCPFLENRLDDESGVLSGLCRLHPGHKPLVCSMAPLGRELQFPNLETWFFTEPIEGCPGCQKATRYDPAGMIGALKPDLDLESRYFQVMENLQRLFAPQEDFQRFHRELEVRESVSDYLSRWFVKTP